LSSRRRLNAEVWSRKRLVTPAERTQTSLRSLRRLDRAAREPGVQVALCKHRIPARAEPGIGPRFARTRWLGRNDAVCRAAFAGCANCTRLRKIPAAPLRRSLLIEQLPISRPTFMPYGFQHVAFGDVLISTQNRLAEFPTLP
jgi:hypothetical protein